MLSSLQRLSAQLLSFTFLCPGAPAPPWPSATCTAKVTTNISSSVERVIESRILDDIKKNSVKVNKRLFPN